MADTVCCPVGRVGELPGSHGNRNGTAFARSAVLAQSADQATMLTSAQLFREVTTTRVGGDGVRVRWRVSGRHGPPFLPRDLPDPGETAGANHAPQRGQGELPTALGEL